MVHGYKLQQTSKYNDRVEEIRRIGENKNPNPRKSSILLSTFIFTIMVGMTQALSTQFKSCRLLLGNVWNKELSIVQRRILRKLRSKKRSRSRNVVANQNSHIQLATRRKLSLFYHEGIHRRERTTSEFVPFLLDLETRLDVLLVRTHFCQTIPQARQLISHGRVCVNNAVRSINHFKVSPGDVISFQNNEAVIAEVRRSLFCSVLKIMGQVQNQPIRLWRRTKVECSLPRQSLRRAQQNEDPFVQFHLANAQSGTKHDDTKMKKLRKVDVHDFFT
ncbi:hypothetical protein MKW98_006305 [Papaver atlanticum]|uniref:RNA-binding S4 domain-containing protein n=1 Tax=Papaver atlanticum TaxID=357466 RepID=A0AAD4TH59_9MAGN|nr:hypothetical protein MKW98_006305 [Papaver atlanticum]